MTHSLPLARDDSAGYRYLRPHESNSRIALPSTRPGARSFPPTAIQSEADHVVGSHLLAGPDLHVGDHRWTDPALPEADEDPRLQDDADEASRPIDPVGAVVLLRGHLRHLA